MINKNKNKRKMIYNENSRDTLLLKPKQLFFNAIKGKLNKQNEIK